MLLDFRISFWRPRNPELQISTPVSWRRTCPWRFFRRVTCDVRWTGQTPNVCPNVSKSSILTYLDMHIFMPSLAIEVRNRLFETSDMKPRMQRLVMEAVQKQKRKVLSLLSEVLNCVLGRGISMPWAAPTAKSNHSPVLVLWLCLVYVCILRSDAFWPGTVTMQQPSCWIQK